jgi:hypothetical protein
MQAFSNEILKEQKLTIGVDLGDRWSFYCVLDEAGKIILELKVATTPEAMKQTFGKIPQSQTDDSRELEYGACISLVSSPVDSILQPRVHFPFSMAGGVQVPSRMALSAQ